MATGRRVVITGATGTIGRAVCAELGRAGHEIIVFSRNPEAARATLPEATAVVSWAPDESGPWAARVAEADAIIPGRRVVPLKALTLGYRFRFPTVELALRDLLAGAKEGSGHV